MTTGPALGARLWWGAGVLLVALWAGGALVAAGIPGLPSAPELTLWALPLVRFARDVCAVITVGVLVVGGLLLPVRPRRMRGWAVGWGVAWLACLVALYALTLSDIRAVGLTVAAEPGSAWTFLVSESVGHAFGWQFVGVALALVASFGARSFLRWTAAVLAVAASAAPAFLGHGGLEHSHAAATISLGLHIAAVSIWVGGLAVCLGLLCLDARHAPVLAPRFSMLALWCVLVVAETGLLNASLRVGSVSAMVATPYGSLVIAKALLLGWLVRLGWLQRRRAMPEIVARGEFGVTGLLRLASSELLVMGAAIGLSVALSRIGPSAGPSRGATFTPLSLTLLAIAAPILLVWCLPPDAARRWVGRLRSYPEVWAVVLLVISVEVAGVRVLASLLGPEPAAIVGSAGLLVAGWLWAAASSGGKGTASISIVAVGWPIVAVLIGRMTDGSWDWQATLVAVALGEVLLLTFLRIARTPSSMPGAQAIVDSEPVRHG